MKAKLEETISIDIDYNSFTTDEIVKIFDFYSAISNYCDGKKTNIQELIDKYNTYRNVLNSIAFEKRYNNMFEKKTGIKIYQTMRDLMNNNK